MRAYYEDDAVTIYHGDCREIVPGLGERFGLVLTDPPFGEETHGNARSCESQKSMDDSTRIDFAAVTVETLRADFALWGSVCDRWIVSFVDWRHAAGFEKCPPDGLKLVRIGVWIKTNPCPQITGDRPAHGWDAICYMHKAGVKLRWNGGGNHGNWYGPKTSRPVHPTEKPLDLLGTLIQRFSEPGDLILDPFAGSGTTGRAAKDLGRRAVLVEREERYCEIAANRMRQGVLL